MSDIKKPNVSLNPVKQSISDIVSAELKKMTQSASITPKTSVTPADDYNKYLDQTTFADAPKSLKNSTSIDRYGKAREFRDKAGELNDKAPSFIDKVLHTDLSKLGAIEKLVPATRLVAGLFSTPDEVAAKKYEEAATELESYKKSDDASFAKGLKQGFGDKFSTKGLATLGMSGLADKVSEVSSYKYIEHKLNNGLELSDAEKDIVSAFYELQEAQRYTQQMGGKTIGQQVGEGAGYIPEFMFQMVTTGGAARWGTSTIKGALKVSEKALTKNLLQKGIRGTAKAAVEGAARTPFQAQLYSNLADETLKQYDLEQAEDGDTYIAKNLQKETSVGTRVYKALANTWLENFSEGLGGAVIDKIPVKRLFGMVAKNSTKADAGAGKTIWGLSAEAPEIVNSSKKFVKDALKYDGPVNEYLEEQVNNLLQPILTGEYENYKETMTLENHWVTLLTCSAFSPVFKAMEVAGSARGYNKQRTLAKEASRSLAMVEDEALRGQVFEAMQDETLQGRAEKLSRINWKELRDPFDKFYALDYILNKTKHEALLGATEGTKDQLAIAMLDDYAKKMENKGTGTVVTLHTQEGESYHLLNSNYDVVQDEEGNPIFKFKEQILHLENVATGERVAKSAAEINIVSNEDYLVKKFRDKLFLAYKEKEDGVEQNVSQQEKADEAAAANPSAQEAAAVNLDEANPTAAVPTEIVNGTRLTFDGAQYEVTGETERGFHLMPVDSDTGEIDPEAVPVFKSKADVERIAAQRLDAQQGLANGELPPPPANVVNDGNGNLTPYDPAAAQQQPADEPAQEVDYDTLAPDELASALSNELGQDGAIQELNDTKKGLLEELGKLEAKKTTSLSERAKNRAKINEINANVQRVDGAISLLTPAVDEPATNVSLPPVAEEGSQLPNVTDSNQTPIVEDVTELPNVNSQPTAEEIGQQPEQQAPAETIAEQKQEQQGEAKPKTITEKLKEAIAAHEMQQQAAQEQQGEDVQFAGDLVDKTEFYRNEVLSLVKKLRSDFGNTVDITTIKSERNKGITVAVKIGSQKRQQINGSLKTTQYYFPDYKEDKDFYEAVGRNGQTYYELMVKGVKEASFANMTPLTHLQITPEQLSSLINKYGVDINKPIISEVVSNNIDIHKNQLQNQQAAEPAQPQAGKKPSIHVVSVGKPTSVQAEVNKKLQEEADRMVEGQPQAADEFGANNKIVTRERAEELKKRLRAKLGNLNSGIDPEVMVLGAELAVFYVEGGVAKFTDFSKKMIEDMGEGITPYLKGFYLNAKHYPAISEELKNSMDKASFVEDFDLTTLHAAEQKQGFDWELLDQAPNYLEFDNKFELAAKTIEHWHKILDEYDKYKKDFTEKQIREFDGTIKILESDIKHMLSIAPSDVSRITDIKVEGALKIKTGLLDGVRVYETGKGEWQYDVNPKLLYELAKIDKAKSATAEQKQGEQLSAASEAKEPIGQEQQEPAAQEPAPAETLPTEAQKQVGTPIKAKASNALKSLYPTDSIYHERPNIPIGKQIKMDATKMVKEMALNCGLEFDADKKGKTVVAHANIAPAGGEVTFKLWIPNSTKGVYVSIPYERNNDYDYELGSSILYRVVDKETDPSGTKGFNQFIEANGKFNQGNLEQAITKALAKHREVKAPEPTPVAQETFAGEVVAKGPRTLEQRIADTKERIQALKDKQAQAEKYGNGSVLNKEIALWESTLEKYLNKQASQEIKAEEAKVNTEPTEAQKEVSSESYMPVSSAKPSIDPYKQIIEPNKKKEERPFMKGVYHNGGIARFTDGHFLVESKILYNEKHEGEIVDKNGDVVDDDVPGLYKKPISTSFIYTISFNAPLVLQQIKEGNALGETIGGIGSKDSKCCFAFPLSDRDGGNGYILASQAKIFAEAVAKMDNPVIGTIVVNRMPLLVAKDGEEKVMLMLQAQPLGYAIMDAGTGEYELPKTSYIELQEKYDANNSWIKHLKNAELPAAEEKLSDYFKYNSMGVSHLKVREALEALKAYKNSGISLPVNEYDLQGRVDKNGIDSTIDTFEKGLKEGAEYFKDYEKKIRDINKRIEAMQDENTLISKVLEHYEQGIASLGNVKKPKKEEQHSVKKGILAESKTKTFNDGKQADEEQPGAPSLPERASHDTPGMDANSNAEQPAGVLARGQAESSSDAQSREGLRDTATNDGAGIHAPRSNGVRDGGANPTNGGGQEANAKKGVRGSAAKPGNVSDQTNNSNNYRYQSTTGYIPKGNVSKVKANIEAITLLKRLEETGQPATEEEKKILSQYVGWGGLSEYLNRSRANNQWEHSWRQNYGPYYEKISELLTDEEFEAAFQSTTNAHYTDAKVIEALWDIAKQLGFKGGNILEPAMGVGLFYGFMPKALALQSKLYGYELDSISGRIAKQLYPDADIKVAGYETSSIKNNSIDLVITNVPFGQTAPYDSKNKDISKFSLHNYFIAKGIRQLKEGGIGIFITSSSTMDGMKSKEFRDWANREGNADMIGAIRLPNNAFEENAGTSVTTDIIIYQKRTNGEKSPLAKDAVGLSVNPEHSYIDTDGKRYEMTINQYYDENPNMMVGNMEFAKDVNRGGLYSAADQTCHLDDPSTFDKRFKAAIKGLPTDIYNATSSESNVHDDTAIAALTVVDGVVMVNNKPVEFDTEKVTVKGRKFAYAEVVGDYVRIRDTSKTLIEKENSSATDEELAPLRHELNQAYDLFLEKYQALNRNRSLGFLEMDSEYYSVLALEDEHVSFEPRESDGKPVKKYTYAKSDIFRSRVITLDAIPTKAENATDAVAICRSYKGRIDAPYIQQLLGLDSEEKAVDAIVASGDVFIDPQTGLPVYKEDYLSGAVRKKLAAAKEYAASDSQFERNVEALEEVQPKDLMPSEIEFNAGSTWIPTDVYEKFTSEVLGFKAKVFYNEVTSKFTIDGYVTDRAKLEQFKHSKLSPIDILEKRLNNATPTVMEYDKTTKKSYVNEKLTDEAKAVSDNLNEEFKNYVYSNREIAEQLAKIYNETKNDNVEKVTIKPTFDHYPGASKVVKGKPFMLRIHQSKAVQRCITGPTLLAHQVGTGKTFTMITAAMEMRRLGTAKKPMIVVQNSTVEQFAKDFKALYPGAKILVPTKQQRSAAERQKLFNRIAYGEYDAIIIPQSFLDFIPDDPKRVDAYLNQQLKELEEMLSDVSKDDRETISSINKQIKELQKKIDSERDSLKLDETPDEEGQGPKKTKTVKNQAKAKDKAKKTLDKQKDRRTDTVLTFEQMGIDALFIDEAHNFKKLGINTNQSSIKGIDISRSKRAFGLYMKTQHVLDKTGKNVVFATGTPITNTMAEVWTMMRFLIPNVLKEYGISHFDQFASTYGNIEDSLEFTATGSFKVVKRFKSFINTPELIRAFRTAADVVLTKHVTEFFGDKKIIPDLKNGKISFHQLKQSETLKRVMEALIRTMHNWDTNSTLKRKYSYLPLLVFNRAKQAAIDVRLINPAATDDPNSKANVVVRNVKDIYDRTSEYNGAQLIFCDSYQSPDYSKAKKGDEAQLDVNELLGLEVDKTAPRFNLYKDMKQKLVAMGVPTSEIALMSDYDTDEKKDRLFSMVNEGVVRIVLGSTEKMGVGVNMQERLAAIHHVDAPPRPMDFEQRNGRIKRQGNKHADWGLPIDIVTYGVEKTLDATAFQRLEIKQNFINQVMEGSTTERNPEEDDDTGIDSDASFGEMMAVLTGSKYAMKHQIAKAKLKKLLVKYNAWRRKYVDAERTIANYDTIIEKIKQDEHTLKAKKAVSKNVFGEEGGKVNQVEYDGKVYNEKFTEVFAGLMSKMLRTFRVKVNGYELEFKRTGVEDSYRWESLDKKPNEDTPLFSDVVNSPGAIFRSLYKEFSVPSDEFAMLQKRVDYQDNLLSFAKETIKLPFAQKEAFDRVQAEFEELEELLKQENAAELLNESMEDEAVSTEEEEAGVRFRKRAVITASANHIAGSLGEQVEVVGTRSELPRLIQKQMKANVKYSGVFDPKTGKTYLVADECENDAEVQATILHEVVGHKGIRQLFGDDVNEFYDRVWESLPKDIKAALAAEHGNDTRLAADEYLASLAELDHTPSVMEHIKAAFKALLAKAGITYKLKDADLKYILWKAKNGIKRGDSAGTIIDKADADLRMRNKLFGKGNNIPDPDGPRFRAKKERKPSNVQPRFYNKNSATDRFVSGVQNRMLASKRLIEHLQKIGGTVHIDNNYYLAENRLSSRADGEFKKFDRELFKPLIDSITKLMKAHGLSFEEVNSYLIYKSALERSKTSKKLIFWEDEGAGTDWTKSNAELFVDTFEKTVTPEELEALWGGIRKATRFNLDRLLKSGNLSLDDYKLMTEGKERHGSQKDLDPWAYYVPLRGWSYAEGEANPLDWYDYEEPHKDGGKGTFAAALIKSKGRSNMSDNPIQYIRQIGLSTIAQANNNEMKRLALNLVRENRNREDLFTMNAIYTVKTIEDEVIELDKKPDTLLKAQALGFALNKEYLKEDVGIQDKAAQEAIKVELDKIREQRKVEGGSMEQLEFTISQAIAGNKTCGLTIKTPYKDRRPDTAVGQHYIEVLENGVKYRISFADARIANEINGDNRKELNRVVQNYIGTPTRWMSSLMTSRNPAFVVANLSRDLGLATIYNLADAEGNTSGMYRHMLDINKAIHREYRGTAQPLTKQEIGILDISNKQDRETLAKQYGDKRINDTMLEVFRTHGGSTGYVHLEDLTDIERRIKKDIEKYTKTGLGSKAKRGFIAPFKATNTALEYLADQSETMTRYANFMAQLDKGKTINEAVQYAKEVTVNFNRRGEYSLWFGSVFSFFNAAVQGVNTIVQLGKRNKKRLAALCMMYAGVSISLQLMCMALGGSDDDDETQLAYDTQLSDYDKYSNWCIPMAPFGGKGFIKIPQPQVFRVINAMTYLTTEVYRGRKSTDAAVNQTMKLFGDDLSPLGLEPTWRSAMPTLLVPIFDVYTNKDFTDRNIGREPFTKEQEKYEARSSRGRRGDSYLFFELNEPTKRLNRLFGGTDDISSGFDPVTGAYSEGKALITDINSAHLRHLLYSYTAGAGKLLSDVYRSVRPLWDEEQEFNSKTLPIVNRFYVNGDSKVDVYREYANKVENYRNWLYLYNNALSNGDIDRLTQMEKIPDMQATAYQVEVYDAAIKEYTKTIGQLPYGNKTRRELEKERLSTIKQFQKSLPWVWTLQEVNHK